MRSLLQELVLLDRAALEASQVVRLGALTPLFVIASAWWVRSLLFVGVAALADLVRRRWVPRSAVCVLVALGAVSGLVTLLKDSFDWVRPALVDPSITALVATPDNPSFPSGHTATAFAAATVVAVLHPRLRWPVLALAATVGLSRVYLGVHFWADVIIGATLGLAIGLAVAWAVPRLEIILRRQAPRSA